MELLKQVLVDNTHNRNISIDIDKASSADTSSFLSFVNTLPVDAIVEAGEPPLKPRNKQVNDVLRNKKGGRHYSPKTDFKRTKHKEEDRKGLVEQSPAPEETTAEDKPVYVYYTIRFKPSPTATPDRIRPRSGYMSGETIRAINRKLSIHFPDASSIDVKEVDEDRFRRHHI